MRHTRSGLLIPATLLALLFTNPQALAQVAPNLGTAASYAVLGTNPIATSGTVTCTGSTINGNVGSTFNSITNTGCTIAGSIDAPVAGSVVADFNAAYSAIDGPNPCTGTIPIVSTTLAPGVYCSAAGTTIGAGVTLTLNGTASDVWVFRVGTGGLGALTLTGTQVVMGGTAQACNVYWKTAEAATLTDSAFVGTVLSGTAFTMIRGSMSGRAFAKADATVTDAAPLSFAACAPIPPATITVSKDFSPDSIATVPVSLACTSGTIASTPLNAAEGSPAVFTVTGATPGTTCTATETVPLGYTANQANCANVPLGGTCTITNTLNSDTIAVSKDFIPNSVATVPVSLACTSGTIASTPLVAAEGSPAVFTVTGASPGTTCTATETVPVGYTANQANCANVPLGGTCTITNTLNSDTIVVNKDFIPNSVATVPVSLACTSGTIASTPLNAAEGSPAVFTVTGASAGTTCTATETVPLGYTANQANCANVPLGGTCTITNTLNSNTITVNKDFIPNSIATVPVSLACTSGTVAATPLNASESIPAIFTVTGAAPGTTCTATEVVPPGYTVNQANCAIVPLGGTCTITNTLNSGTIVVNKDFIPNSAATVPVSLACTSGAVTTTPLNASESAPAVFTVAGATPGTTCTATEAVPPGYTANQVNCTNMPLGSSCTITNALNSNTITVRKDFTPNSVVAVPVNLACTSGTVTTTPLNASESTPAVFTVTGATPGTTCTATETAPPGYTANQANCANVALGSVCTISNTLNSDTIAVHKDFSPNSTATVPVRLTCTSGTVTATPLNTSESTPAIFTVTGATPGATCTATETVPLGYTANQASCVNVALGGSCTITNTLNSNTIAVHKDFSPNSAATAPVSLACTSGAVAATPLNASESTPAVFTVTGAAPGTTCTATETVPPGYTANEASCVNVTLGGSCTITNILNSNTITVSKDFIPNSAAAVTVSLTCTSGMVTATPLNVSEPTPAVFTVTGATPGATCTASEAVPAGYMANQANCVNVPLGGACTITNSLIGSIPEVIPTLSEWAMILLAGLLAMVGFAALRGGVRH